MPYAILRFQKKKAGGLASAYCHNERKKEAYKSNPNIKKERSKENYHLVEPTKTYHREAKDRIIQAGCRIRQNSVMMVETLITASPEFMRDLSKESEEEFFKRAYRFMVDKVGEQNIISAVVHKDEKTPHMHLSFCPITKDNRLSAKDILGNQKSLSQWQTDFHDYMSERWPELERGISSMETKRKHIPLWIFKSAERLDKQCSAVEKALQDINVINAKKKREDAINIIREWLPEVEQFISQVKFVDGYVRTLIRENTELISTVRKEQLKTREVEDI